jgi:hypothetical protein
MVTKKKAATPVAPVGPKADVFTALQKLDADQQKLTDTRTKLLAGAKAELLTQAQTVLASLKTLGFVYTLTEPGKKSHHKLKSESSGRERASPSGICPICTWGTEPPHDRRAHRWQKVRAPFNEEELARRGLVRR